MTGRDPKSIIDHSAMGLAQWLAVLVTVALNALDGFDVLSISFASPGIAKDWGIDKATLGWVLSMELFGMALGSVLLGGVADKLGRRTTILGCLVAMAAGMWGAGHAHGVYELLPWRLLTGVGIGGTLASINAAAAELTNLRWRNFALALMVIG
jgi:MFS family permease